MGGTPDIPPPHVLGGATPPAPNFDAKLAKARPLSAFALLEGGDVFESLSGRPPPMGPVRAKAYVASRLNIQSHGAADAVAERVRADIVKLIEGNLELLARLEVAR